MDGVTKADMQNAIQHLRNDIQQMVLGRQEVAILLSSMANQIMIQIRDQQATTRQISSQLNQINQLSQHLPAIEQNLNYCKKDLQQITSR